MRARHVIAALTGAIIGGSFGWACTPAQQQTAKTVTVDVLNAAQYACVVTTDLIAVPEVAVACGIVKTAAELAPSLEGWLFQLLSDSQAMKRQGYSYTPTKGWVK